MERLNASVDVDRELWREDIQGSIVHAQGLVRARVLTPSEGETIVAGLQQIAQEIEAGQFKWDESLEDVHMNIEARLIEVCGPIGGKLHTGRSRNDQVATDLRLWCRRKTDETLECLRELASVLIERAEQELDTLMPAYTHLQRAQPSRLSHHLMSWQELLWRDYERLGAARARLNECPLGAGAVAGSGFALDRTWVAQQLGFSHPMRNSVDATASRDFLMELAAGLAILGVHLSRIGEELVIWSSQEFSFLSLSDQFTTSSSMMPQKKNPDVGELVRGTSARLIGNVTALLVLEKSLAFGYGRDLQEDKVPIFESFDGTLNCLMALNGALRSATFQRDNLRRALDRGHLCATDLADYLVGQGLPFRQAHHVVGSLVRKAEQAKLQLGELSPDILAAAHDSLSDPVIAEVLDPTRAVERRRLLGGPALTAVASAIAEAKRRWAF